MRPILMFGIGFAVGFCVVAVRVVLRRRWRLAKGLMRRLPPKSREDVRYLTAYVAPGTRLGRRWDVRVPRVWLLVGLRGKLRARTIEVVRAGVLHRTER